MWVFENMKFDKNRFFLRSGTEKFSTRPTSQKADYFL